PRFVHAEVAEPADAADSKSVVPKGRVGSTPTFGTASKRLDFVTWPAGHCTPGRRSDSPFDSPSPSGGVLGASADARGAFGGTSAGGRWPAAVAPRAARPCPSRPGSFGGASGGGAGGGFEGAGGR